jgi:uncharacterized membrane protein
MKEDDKMANSQETNHFHLDKLLPPKGWRFLIIILLAIGIFFRFTNLDKKIYWHDETYTSLRISGYSQKEELEGLLYNGDLISPWDLQKFQQVNSEKTLNDTLQQLAHLEPQVSPLYVTLARFWSEGFGSSVAVIRSLSALINLLIFPGIYWLGWELFQSPTISWMSVGLIAISPFHLLYAQEARSYSLWTVTILLSNAAFLRALRVKTTKSWVIYGMTMALNLYSHPLSILMGIMHGIYLLGIAGFRQQKILISYCLTWLGIIIGWMPWLWVIIKNLEKAHETVSWTERKTTKIWLLTSFFKQITLGFIDFTELLKNPHKLIHVFSLIAIFLLLVLIGYSLYCLVGNTSKKSGLFIVLLIGFGGLIFLLFDLFLGGIRSLYPRYLIPYYLGIHIAVTQMLYQKIISPITLQKKLGIGILVILISSSLMSSSFISQQECSWSREFSCDNIKISRIINESSEPLILSDIISDGNNRGQLFSLSYKLHPQVRIQLVNSPNKLKIAPGYRDIFLYNVSPILREEIARSRPFQIQSVYQGKHLKLEKLAPPK